MYIHTIGANYLITSSGRRNNVQASQGGVGLLLDQKSRRALLKVRSVNKRIMIADFDSNPNKTTIVVIYSPTNAAEEEAVEEF